MTQIEFKNVGMKLRQARLTKQLRLRDVAERAGCSEGMLSKIERDRVVPSLRILHRVTEVLDTSLAELFADPNSDGVRVFRSGNRPTIELGSSAEGSAVVLERMVPHNKNNIIDGNIHVVAPGASNGGTIKHVGQEVGFILEGTLELTIEDDVYSLSAGDSFFFESTLLHSYRNTSDTVTRIVWVNSPPTI